MKKILLTILLLSLTGCGSGNFGVENNDFESKKQKYSYDLKIKAEHKLNSFIFSMNYRAKVNN